MLQGISAEYIGGELSHLVDKITSILKKEIDSYGLSPEAKKRLLDLISSSRPHFKSCPL